MPPMASRTTSFTIWSMKEGFRSSSGKGGH
jgi:hypothetical protein